MDGGFGLASQSRGGSVVRTGASPVRRTIRKLSGMISIGVALVLLAGGVAELGSTSVAGASTPTTVTSFTAKPTSLTWAGGAVTLSAKVANAKTCTFSVTPKVEGLPAEKACASGTVDEKVTVPKNTGTKPITYTFGLTVTGATTVKAKAFGLGESDDLPGAPTGVSARPGKLSASVSFSRPSSAGSTPITRYTVTATDTTTATDGGQKQSGTSSPITIAGLTNGDSYIFTVAASNASGTGPASAKSNSVLIAVRPSVAAIRSTASDGYGFCEVLSTGRVDCWGDNDIGELGNGTTNGPDCASNGHTCYDTPQTVTGITNAIAVASDDYYSYCAVLSTGRVDCWGFNGNSQLGNGTTGGPDGDPATGYDTPQGVTGITTAVSLTSNDELPLDSEYGYCAVLSSGRVDCWGYNLYGELGNGKTEGPDGDYGYDTPQGVADITNAVSLVSDSSAEGTSYCAVLSSGRVDCWGYNRDGELGNGKTSGPDGNYGYDTPQGVSGITNAVAVASNWDNEGYCAVLSSGRVECWGINEEGEVGNGTIGGSDCGGACDDLPQAVSGITDALSVTGSVGGYCAVLTTGGVECWGENSLGELGNHTIGGSDGVDGYDTPQVVAGLTNAVSVTTDPLLSSYCAVLSSGRMECWGYNFYGELGHGTVGGPDSCGLDECYDTPQAVTGITDASTATNGTGEYDGYCAVLSSGRMDCWGNDTNGELGNGTTDDPDGVGGYDTPQVVTGITDAV
jgi:alpha-tubulin suppressor-like RCC1 family protein